MHKADTSESKRSRQGGFTIQVFIRAEVKYVHVPRLPFCDQGSDCKGCWIRSESQTEEPYTGIDRVGVDTPGP